MQIPNLPDTPEIFPWFKEMIYILATILVAVIGLFYRKLIKEIADKQVVIDTKDAEIKQLISCDNLNQKISSLEAELVGMKEKEGKRQEILVNELVTMKNISKDMVSFLDSYFKE